jgi:hypothetical protein
MIELNTDQHARLLFKALHEPRRNQKRFLKDLGGEGSADELDRVLAIANASAEAIAIAHQLDQHRKLSAKAIEIGIDARVAEMLADVRVRMKLLGLTQSDVADHCGWNQSVVAAYLTGAKEPGIGNLSKLATAVGCVWRLTTPA